MIENRTNNVENSSSRGSLTAELNWDTSAWTHHSIPLYSLNRHGITINNRQQGFTEDRSTVCALAVTSQNSITSQEMVDLASLGGGGVARATAPGPGRLQSEVKATHNTRLIDD